MSFADLIGQYPGWAMFCVVFATLSVSVGMGFVLMGLADRLSHKPPPRLEKPPMWESKTMEEKE